VDCEGYGVSALLLGAGRNRKEDVIDPTAGIILHAKTGDAVTVGQPLATLYTSDSERLDAAKDKLLASTAIGSEKPAPRPLVHGVVE
jgi:pyrimidine-nucleoside phosphorylase